MSAPNEELEVHQAWREVYLGRRTLLREMPLIGWTHYHQALPDLHAHAHPETFEISLVVRGSVVWWAGESVHEVRRGEVYITAPGEVHGGQDTMMQPCELYWLHVQIPRSGKLRGMSPAETKRLADDFAHMRLRKFCSSPMVADCFARILGEHQKRSEYSAAVSRAALHELLIQLVQDHAAELRRLEQAPAARSARIARAVEWMEQRLGERFCVTDVARAVGMGVSHFHKRFVQEVGSTPAEYCARRRISLAKQRLRDEPESITHIAHALGFSTSQYFATAFAHVVGMTPRDYRRYARSPAPLERAKAISAK